MALLIKARPGLFVRVVPDNGRAFSLLELQRFVGGYIEIVRMRGRNRLIVLNEDGKRLQLPTNELATRLLHHAGGSLFDWVVGDVILGTLAELGGADDDVDEDEERR